MNLRYAWIGILVIGIVLLAMGGVVQYYLATSREDPKELEYTRASQQLWLGTFGIFPIMMIVALTMLMFNVLVVFDIKLTSSRVELENFMGTANNRLARLITALERLANTLRKESAKLGIFGG